MFSKKPCVRVSSPLLMFSELFVVILSFLLLKNDVFHLNGRHLEILKFRRVRELAHGRIVRSRACAMQNYGITLNCLSVLEVIFFMFA